MAGLDGVRGLAILAVMGHHLLPGNYPHGIPSGAEGIVIKTIYRLFDIGWWGVDLFFVLSGFLITGILLEARGSAHYFGNFYARRSLRIAPLYYGLLAFFFILVPWLLSAPATGAWLREHAGHLASVSESNAPLQSWLWLYLANLRMAMAPDGWIFGTLTHFWSLAVEEHFYLIWPFVVGFCAPRTLARVCLWVAAGALVCRAGFYFAGLTPAYIYVLSPCRFDGLALGGFVATRAYLWRTEPAQTPGPGSPAPGLWPSVRLLLRDTPPAGHAEPLFLAAFRRIFLWTLPLAALVLLTCPRFGWFTIIAGHSLFAIAFAAGLPGAARARRSTPLARGGWLCFPPLIAFGKYSYGLYVLHPFILEPISDFLARPAVQHLLGGSYVLTAALRYAIGLPLSLLIAWVVWHCFEKHFLSLKRFFPTGKSRSAAAADDRAPGLTLPVSPTK